MDTTYGAVVVILEIVIIALLIWLLAISYNTRGIIPNVIQREMQRTQAAQTPHYLSASPAPNQQLSSAPSQIQINFDTTMDTAKSKMSVQNPAGQNVSSETVFSGDKRSMMSALNIKENGIYTARYTACFEGNNCFDGSFVFSVKMN